MKDIHDFAAASLPGVMLEVMVLKKQMEPEVLAERSYTIGRAMMAEAVKNGKLLIHLLQLQLVFWMMLSGKLMKSLKG
mgnify:CR=1 FL=1